MTKKKEQTKWWLTIVSVVLSLATFIALCLGFSKMTETKTIGAINYTIGSINESGKIVESKQSAYTRSTYSVEGMTIKLDEKTSTITYRVAFYDEDDVFVSMTEALSTDFSDDLIPTTAKTFRILVTPETVDGEPVKLNIFNVTKYTNQLKVTIKK